MGAVKNKYMELMERKKELNHKYKWNEEEVKEYLRIKDQLEELENNEEYHINTYTLNKAKRMKSIKMINQNPEAVKLTVQVDHTNEIKFIAKKV